MEQLNKVELRGIVGNARVQSIGDTEMVRFSVATDYAFSDKAGNNIIETTWHQVTAFKGDRMPDFSKLARGAKVEVEGRLRNNKYMAPDGEERTSVDILASRINLLEEAE